MNTPSRRPTRNPRIIHPQPIIPWTHLTDREPPIRTRITGNRTPRRLPPAAIPDRNQRHRDQLHRSSHRTPPVIHHPPRHLTLLHRNKNLLRTTTLPQYNLARPATPKPLRKFRRKHKPPTRQPVQRIGSPAIRNAPPHPPTRPNRNRHGRQRRARPHPIAEIPPIGRDEPIHPRRLQMVQRRIGQTPQISQILRPLLHRTRAAADRSRQRPRSRIPVRIHQIPTPPLELHPASAAPESGKNLDRPAPRTAGRHPAKTLLHRKRNPPLHRKRPRQRKSENQQRFQPGNRPDKHRIRPPDRLTGRQSPAARARRSRAPRQQEQTEQTGGPKESKSQHEYPSDEWNCVHVETGGPLQSHANHWLSDVK